MFFLGEIILIRQRTGKEGTTVCFVTDLRDRIRKQSFQRQLIRQIINIKVLHNYDLGDNYITWPARCHIMTTLS